MRGKERKFAECINECESDSQCEDVEKCCEYGCNRVCLPPVRTTSNF